MIRRLGVLAGAIAASLAFAASAQAAPSTPQLAPIPDYVCGAKPTISWTKSTPDIFGSIVAYRLDIGDLTAGTCGTQGVKGMTSRARLEIGRRSSQSEALEPPVQRAAAEAERLGRVAHIASIARQRFLDEEAFHLFEAHLFELAGGFAGGAQPEIPRGLVSRFRTW